MSDFYEVFGEGADNLAKKALDALEGALDRKKKYRVACPKCKHSFAAPFPDFAAIAKAVEVIRDTGKGKPAQAKPPKEEPKSEGRKPQDFSDEELEARIKELREKHGKADR